jgi:hypothetical protein
MDAALKDRLLKIGEQIDKLRVVEKEFLYLEAHKKVMFSGLYLAAEGKNVAEKEANAYASQDWVNFIDGHAEKEAAYNYERRMYELRLKAYDAAHLTLKTETPAISRQGAIT